MALIEFVRNYEDLSTDRGYQFKFHCDKCGNGHMTRFQTSALGMAESALRAAGDLFGGVFGRAGQGAYEIQRAVGGKAHDDALQEAVGEGKQHFHQCARCGRWVCPEVCWNGPANMCNGCAPNLEREMAAAQAEAKVDAARQQLHQRAQEVDYASGIDMSAGAVLRAPDAAGPAAAAGSLATSTSPLGVSAAGVHCAACNTAMGAAKFCPECGQPRPPSGCPSCHAAVPPGTKFCGECGTKVV
jgi:hypothetical protein